MTIYNIIDKLAGWVPSVHEWCINKRIAELLYRVEKMNGK